MNNVKAGDLAVIVRSTIPAYEPQIGRIVSVLRRYVPGEVLPGHDRAFQTYPGSVSWVVEFCGAPAPITARGRLVLSSRLHSARDSSLRPILPPPDSVSDDEVKELFAPSVSAPKKTEAV